MKILLACILLFASVPAFAADPTAFDLAKEGNRYIGEQSKDKVVQIRSEKSVASLTPTVWYVVYYDPDAPLKAVEVKFGAGKKLDVSRPLRLLEPITGHNRELDRAQFKTDSPKAIKVALKEKELKGLTVKATQLWLQRGGDGVVWRVKLWAAKLRHPNENADIGDVFISAATGKVIRTELHINRVD